MNEIVRKILPVTELPEELRADFDPMGIVEIVGPASMQAPAEGLSQPLEGQPPDRVMTLEEMFALRRPPYLSKEEIDDHIRALRGEWDERG